MMCSGVFAGVFDLRLRLRAHRPRRQARSATNCERIGYRGASRCGAARSARISSCTSSRARSSRPRARTIGVVTGVQGMRWFDVTVTGTRAMPARRRCRCARMRWSRRPRMVARGGRDRRRARAGRRRHVGLVECQPNCAQRDPGRGVVLRRPAPSGRRRRRRRWTRADARRGADDRCEPAPRGRRSSAVWDFAAGARSMPPASPPCARRPTALGYSAREIVSGAGHDSLPTSPAWRRPSMIFVPCEDGLSHNEAESTESGAGGGGRERPAAGGCSTPTALAERARAADVALTTAAATAAMRAVRRPGA